MGNNRPKLTQEYLKECLTYDPETGIFVWNKRPLSHFKNSRGCNMWNVRYSGTEAGSFDKCKYICISLNKKRYKCHRLAFLYMEGYLPENDVDHMDKNPSNNKWCNLREVSSRCNGQNCGISKNNTSGVSGVGWSKAANKWCSKIMIDRKSKHLGLFDKFEDAVIARYQEEITNPLWTCSVESTAYKYLKEKNLI